MTLTDLKLERWLAIIYTINSEWQRGRAVSGPIRNCVSWTLAQGLGKLFSTSVFLLDLVSPPGVNHRWMHPPSVSHCPLYQRQTPLQAFCGRMLPLKTRSPPVLLTQAAALKYGGKTHGVCLFCSQSSFSYNPHPSNQGVVVVSAGSLLLTSL